jgi:formylglycine-generating enzyme required for sulfatase activity
MRLIISVLLVVSSLLFVQENNKQHKDEFALVDGGSFMMGSEDGEDSEQPVHKVTLNSFYIGKYEVTQGEWQSLMGDDTPYKKLGPNYPVHHIDFYSALAYCNKKSINEGLTPCYSIDGKTNIEEANTWGSSLPECNFEANGYRLPTEAEWEYAARGGKLSKGFTFSGSDEVDVVAWYDKNTDQNLKPVGTKKPNELGIYDMSGNVDEMCWDNFDDEFYEESPEINPKNTDDYQQVIRGGSFFYGPGNCYVYRRMVDETTNYIQIIGLRIVKTKK